MTDGSRGRGARLLITADAAGGVWTYALDLAAGLSSAGVMPVIAVLGPAPRGDQLVRAAAIPGLELLPTGLPLDWLAEGPEELRASGEALATLAEAARVDAVHLNSPAHAAGTAFPVPVVAVSHSCVVTWWDAVYGGALPPDFAWHAELMRRGCLAASTLVTPSRAFGEATARRYALPRRPVVVHNGRRPMAPPGEVPAGTPPLFVLTAGRLWDKGKNLRTLDLAAARLDVPVLAAGPVAGPNGDRAEPRHVRALGHLGEPALAALLAQRPIYASLALYEPFGLAVLEAASAGCPLVLSDIPTFRELWGAAALYVPPRDEAAAAAAIARLAADPAERARLGAAARRRAARYTVDTMAGAMLDVYRPLILSGSVAA
ncbi:glycosyltransferase family 4 protein [Roseomonas sp. KE2513]|uniref:glycosyltransferase family 4 protein n=1 Tax=Roseomonas sp. KE2513 TaxID=2479202 RepID=UPI002816529B|nr:glycosyltransferase family 4 protein [Roseomonas sp. KE2513]